MAKNKDGIEQFISKNDASMSQKVSSPKADLAKLSETKVKFLVWFSDAVDKYKDIPNGLRAHHMDAVRDYFRHLGLSGKEEPTAFDEGLLKFGFRGNK